MGIETRTINNAELDRVLALAHKLVQGPGSMTFGDLLAERLRIKHVTLPSDKSAQVIAQIDESMQSEKDMLSRKRSPILFAEAVLFPLVGTARLAQEELKHLLALLDEQPLLNLSEDSQETVAIEGLCHSNAAGLEQLVSNGSANLLRIMAIYRHTRSSALLQRLAAEAAATLCSKKYTSETARERTKQVLSTIIKYPPDASTLKKMLPHLLSNSEPSAKGRDEIESAVAETGDVTLLLPLLLAFAADTGYQQSLGQRSSVEDAVEAIHLRQERLLWHFTSPGAIAVRKLYETLTACQAIPLHSDHTRMQLRRQAVAHARTVFRCAKDVLIDFVSAFSQTDDGQADLVYVLCCLPKQHAISFLRDRMRRDDLTQTQHSTLALALSYISGAPLPSGQEKHPAVSHGSNQGRTWLGDEKVEQKFFNACARATVHVSRIFESSPASHEERLTGIFLEKMQSELHNWARNVETWATKRFGRNSHIRCTYEDVAANGPEKVWGADVGFYLRILANGELSSERAFLLQAKKARLSKDGQEVSWRIDRFQRDVLIGQSSWSMFLLYGCHSTGTEARVVPAVLVRDLMIGMKTRSQLSASKAISVTRPFAEFFTYEFLANWWGDRDGRALDVVRGRIEDFPVRAIFSIDVNLGMVG